MCYKMTRDYGVAKTGWHDPGQHQGVAESPSSGPTSTSDGPDECWPWKRKPTRQRIRAAQDGSTAPCKPTAWHTFWPMANCPPQEWTSTTPATIRATCLLRTQVPAPARCCNPAHLEASAGRRRTGKRGDMTRPGNGKIQRSRKCEPGCTCHAARQSRRWRQQAVRAGMHLQAAYRLRRRTAALSARLHLRKAPPSESSSLIQHRPVVPVHAARRPLPQRHIGLEDAGPRIETGVAESLPVKIGGMRLITVPTSLPIPGATAGSRRTTPFLTSARMPMAFWYAM